MKDSNRQAPPQDPSGTGAPAPPRPASERISLARKRPARILLLDDEPILRESTKLCMQHLFTDYEVAECVNGADAMHEIAAHPLDLLIADYRHRGPRLDDMLQSLSRGPHRFPIVLLSASDLHDVEFLQRFLAFPGFHVEVLSKPFALASLRATVLKCLSPVPAPQWEQ